MDKSISDLLERSKSVGGGGGGSPSGTAAYVNGGMRRPCSVGSGGLPSPGHLGPTPACGQVLRVVVNRDERGYGMKVSGDKPVYVQSVKEGGAAEKAGLHADDKIIQVNGVDVMESTHTEVVALIRSQRARKQQEILEQPTRSAANQVVLTVQQKPRMMGSPSLHTRPIPIQSSTRITGPKPVDNEKLRQIHAERVQTFRLMLEEEQRYVDSLRSDLARCPGDEKKLVELTNAEKNVATLQSQLQGILNSTEPSPSSMSYPCPTGPLSGSMTLPSKSSLAATTSHKLPHSHSTSFTELPPPLPKRNKVASPDSLATMNAMFLNNEVISNNLERYSNTVNIEGSNNNLRTQSEGKGSVMVRNNLYNSDIPPPLPPRVPLTGNNTDSDAVNSINKQMSYPLVATCATLCNNYPTSATASTPGSHTHHQRTKSSPDPLGTVLPLSTGESSRRLAASESLNDLSSTRGAGDSNWDVTATPPGTPPPPYPSPLATKRHTHPSSVSSNRNSANTEDGDSFHEESLCELSPEASPLRGAGSASVMATSSPIVAATPNVVQPRIISMEDDEISDQEVIQMDDHGPFKSLSRLWEHTPHLAVFMNYVLSNSDPSSLLFYLLTDLYKEGNAKDMRKWAYEIHSSFLVPGAPLRLSNVDENIAREIDDVLLREGDKEEILRKIFWKARNRAKEELNEQLADFQQKRTAGLGTIFGPPDARLVEISHDKAKEVKLYETLLLSKLEPYLDELEKDVPEPRRYITAAALATLITKLFGVRGVHSAALDRCPMFISKDKSFRTKLIGRYSRKLNVYGHHYVALHYFSVISCNNCHHIIYGIGPQGYQCSVCLINLHRHCVKQYEDSCPGPISKKDRGIGKFMERIRPDSKDSRRKPSAYFISMEREKRLNEEKDSVPESDQFTCDRPLGQPVSRSSSDKRPDAVTEEATRGSTDGPDVEVVAEVSHDNLNNVQRAKSSQPAINRSESYKEQSQKRRQIRERRKISDPNLSKSNDVDSDHQELSYHSGSSSNSSLSSSRSSESPQSTSLDQVPGAHGHHHHHHHHHSTASSASAAATNWDSDIDIEPDPPDWQSSVSEDVLARLHPEEKKRQEIINELFHTERSHVRNLKVLETVFYRPLLQNKCLPPDQVRLLFPNLEEMLDIHGTFNAAMKARRKEEPIIGDIGELLLNMFDGQEGETFKEAAAKFCARQQLALESLKEKRRKNPQLNSFLTDCESDKLCKRLQLKDIIPTGMQRLVKYPLLFDSLARCTERVLDSTMTDSLPSSSPTNTPTIPQMGPTPTELVRLKRAVERSKEILNYVNQAVKEAEDRARLQEIQKRLDKTGFEKNDHAIAKEFPTLDLTKHKLIHEGPLLWRINKQNKLSVHVVLMEEIILLLQKQDEKYILKFHTSGSVVHSPIVKVSTVLVRHNATEKESLYIVNTSPNGAQIYELSAQSPKESKVWFKHISDAAEAYKSREGKSRRSELSTPEPAEAAAAGDLAGSGSGDLDTPTDTDRESTSAENSARNSGVIDDDVASATDKRLSQTEPIPQPAPEPAGQTVSTPPPTNDVVASGGSSKREAQMRLAGDDQPLIQPSEVTVNVLPVHTAQPVITPIEQVRRKDEAIRLALAEKEALVAEILQVPPEDYHTIADMAGDISGEKEPSELVLAAVNQANLLSSLVSESLNISEAVQVSAASSGTASCASASPAPGTVPTIPTHRLSSVANALNSQLTALLRLVKDREEERERMRRELQKLREQLHSIHETTPQHTASDTDIFHSAGDLANIEEDP